MTTASKASDYLLSKARLHGDWLTNLKLQKLLYYCQGWHLAIRKRPLFEDKFQAWVHGPAVPHIYGRFKHNAWNPIGDEVVSPEVAQDEQEILDEVFEKYGHFSGLELEQMTHEETPWREARGSLPPEAQSKKEISTEAMARFFSDKLNAQ